MGNSIGRDPLGDYLLTYLKNNKIGHEVIHMNDHFTPTCSIYIDRMGERTIISSGYENCSGIFERN